MSAPRWEWKQPHGADGSAQPVLQLFSSYHGKNVPFTPAAGPQSRQISWYTCGPTVYEVSHMGHARNYLTSDVMRRVLEDYFGYNIHFVMNVTDVDDKIILKARRAHHLQRYRDSRPQPDEVRQRIEGALQNALLRQQEAVQRLEGDVQAAEAKAAEQSHSATTQKAAEDLRSRLSLAQTAVKRSQDQQQQLTQDSGPKGDRPADALLAAFGDVLAEALDAEGGDVDITDHAVFKQHARRYEAEFVRDMDDLGLRRPTAMPRVSEYVPEIVAYIGAIVDKGLAYERNGSVYFDTRAFEAEGHQYRKLSPSAATAADELAGDGEADFATSEKRNPRDFALWKASKPGEPTWESPWGRGRPGWHIECSAMANELIGGKVDIHTGGIDLRFPHHDNEIAQAEAFLHGREGSCDCHQWVNYFLHLGHLHIEGLKMSKSLKNFITIRDALSNFSARQLRLMMCLQPWNAPMTFGEQAKEAMVSREKELRNFFGNVVSALRETEETVAQRASAAGDAHRWHTTRWQAEEMELNRQLQAAQEGVHAALCNNIDTQATLQQLSSLITAVNKYLAKRPLPHGTPPDGLLPQADLVRRAAEFVLRIVSVLGLVPAASDRLSSFNVDAGGGGGAGVEAWRPFADAFADFRETVRRDARDAQKQQTPAEALQGILAACDRARDETLAGLGVRLEDRPDGTSTWKEEDPAVLAAERAQAKAAAAVAQASKLKKQLTQRQAELEKLDALAAKPSIQKQLAEKFSRDGWTDAEGYPTSSADGSVDFTQPESKKAGDKARAAVDKARKARAPLTKVQQEDGGQWRSKRQAEVEQLRRQLEQLQPADSGLLNGC